MLAFRIVAKKLSIDRTIQYTPPAWAILTSLDIWVDVFVWLEEPYKPRCERWMVQIFQTRQRSRDCSEREKHEGIISMSYSCCIATIKYRFGVSKGYRWQLTSSYLAYCQLCCEAFWMTLISDKRQLQSSLPETFQNNYLSWRLFLTDVQNYGSTLQDSDQAFSSLEMEQHADYYTAFRNATNARRLCITKIGYMALVSPGFQPW